MLRLDSLHGIVLLFPMVVDRPEVFISTLKPWRTLVISLIRAIPRRCSRDAIPQEACRARSMLRDIEG